MVIDFIWNKENNILLCIPTHIRAHTNDNVYTYKCVNIIVIHNISHSLHAVIMHELKFNKNRP